VGEKVRAHLRVLVKRILRKYGYRRSSRRRQHGWCWSKGEVLSADWATSP